jgi:hypothetical protein
MVRQQRPQAIMTSKFGWHGQWYSIARGLIVEYKTTGKRVHLPMPPKTIMRLQFSFLLLASRF